MGTPTGTISSISGRFVAPRGCARTALTRAFCICLVAFVTPQIVTAQLTPGIGYMFPPGGRPGENVDVVLGGYDWTPDMQLFPHDSRITLQMTGTPGQSSSPNRPTGSGRRPSRSPFLLPRDAGPPDDSFRHFARRLQVAGRERQRRVRIRTFLLF